MAHLGPHLYTEDSNEIVEPATDVFEIDDFTSPSDWEKVVMSSNLQQIKFKITQVATMDYQDNLQSVAIYPN